MNDDTVLEKLSKPLGLPPKWRTLLATPPANDNATPISRSVDDTASAFNGLPTTRDTRDPAT